MFRYVLRFGWTYIGFEIPREKNRFTANVFPVIYVPEGRYNQEDLFDFAVNLPDARKIKADDNGVSYFSFSWESVFFFRVKIRRIPKKDGSEEEYQITGEYFDQEYVCYRPWEDNFTGVEKMIEELNNFLDIQI